MRIKDILEKADRAQLAKLKARLEQDEALKLSYATAAKHVLRGKEKRLRWVSKNEAARVLSFESAVARRRQVYATQVGHNPRTGKLIMPIPHHPARLPDLDLRGQRGA